MKNQPPIVLASTSVYRRELLARLGFAFQVASPTTGEQPLPGESPEELVSRLAEAKARSIASAYPDTLIIGSDQVAVLDGDILGKPGNAVANIQQLSNAAGRRVTFLTGLCLLHAGTNEAEVDIVPFSVVFRELTSAQIANYVRRDRPFDCAGGFKSEALGIALFQRMEGEDPTALVGLPLIRLVDMLERQGVDVLMDGAVSGKDQIIEEKDKALEEKGKALEEKDRTLEENARALAENARALAEKDRLIAELQKPRQ